MFWQYEAIKKGHSLGDAKYAYYGYVPSQNNPVCAVYHADKEVRVVTSGQVVATFRRTEEAFAWADEHLPRWIERHQEELKR
jgi:hypothetical protein